MLFPVAIGAAEPTIYLTIPTDWFLKWPLQRRYNGCYSVSNHQPHDCFLNRLFRRRSKKTSQLRATGFVVHGIQRGPVNSPHKWPVTRKMFPFDDLIMHFSGWTISEMGIWIAFIAISVRPPYFVPHNSGHTKPYRTHRPVYSSGAMDSKDFAINSAQTNITKKQRTFNALRWESLKTSHSIYQSWTTVLS